MTTPSPFDELAVKLHGEGPDERDLAIVAERVKALDAVPGARVGDYVIFADGVTRRISYDWGNSVQTSRGGSWYLGHGYTSFSGGLYRGVPTDTLTDTGETRDGTCWIFRHDMMRAHNGVDVRIPFRVFRCSEVAPD